MPKFCIARGRSKKQARDFKIAKVNRGCVPRKMGGYLPRKMGGTHLRKWGVPTYQNGGYLPPKMGVPTSENRGYLPTLKGPTKMRGT